MCRGVRIALHNRLISDTQQFLGHQLASAAVDVLMVIRIFTRIGFNLVLAHLPGLVIDDGRMRGCQLRQPEWNAAAKHEDERLLHRN